MGFLFFGRGLTGFLFRQVPDELDDMLRFPGRELAQEGLELAGLAGGFQLRVEEILGPDAEIVANAEKAGHGGPGAGRPAMGGGGQAVEGPLPLPEKERRLADRRPHPPALPPRQALVLRHPGRGHVAGVPGQMPGPGDADPPERYPDDDGGVISRSEAIKKGLLQNATAS